MKYRALGRTTSFGTRKDFLADARELAEAREIIERIERRLASCERCKWIMPQ